MKHGLTFLAVLAAFGAIEPRSSADEFYGALEQELGTNNTPREITNALLLDPSNTVQRLTNSILSFETLSPDDQLLGLRLGMTIGQVFERWGKPKKIWVPCNFRPCLHYENAFVFFDPTNQVVDEVSVSKPPELRVKWTSPLGDFDKCVGLLGEPDERKITPDPFSQEGLDTIPSPGRGLRAPYFFCDATYVGTGARKILFFNGGELVSVSLVGYPRVQKEQK
jgi:hypothetical protein